MYATGSVECITPAFATPVFTEELRRHNLCTYDHAAPGLYATVAFSLTGGNILQWFRNEFAPGETYEAVLATMPVTPTNLLVLPYWTPSGTPHFDCDTPGAILGLRLSTHRNEILRALLEGVAFEMRLNLGILESAGCHLEELRAIGGGSRSPMWNQLKADVLGMPLTRLEISEAGCLGAAILACASDTGRTAAQITAEWVKPGERFEPVSSNVDRYNGQFDRYKRVRPAMRTVLNSRDG
jgi:xylulokinase